MKVLYSPQFNEFDELEYEFIGDKIIATYNGQTDEFDFTNMPEGCFVTSYRRDKEIITTLPIDTVLDAERINGILQVRLVRFINSDAEHNDKFPDWIEV